MGYGRRMLKAGNKAGQIKSNKSWSHGHCCCPRAQSVSMAGAAPSAAGAGAELSSGFFTASMYGVTASSSRIVKGVSCAT
mmetsp:Transcript_9084/g.27675  ORF Transcript_9084/g.27675 Transcript_9084/m.27675 type:complete len:80 (+) Transcript_9084:250-489(+)